MNLSEKKNILDHFKYLSLFKLTGFLTHKIDYYLGFTNSKSIFRFIYSRLICGLFWLITLQQFCLMFIDDNTLKIFSSDFTENWLKNRFQYLIPTFLVYLQCAMCHTLFLYKEKDLNWLKPFLIINRQISNKPIISVDYLKKNEIFGIIFVVLPILLILTIFIGFTEYAILLSFNPEIYQSNWLFRWIFKIISFFYPIFINYLIATYFYLVCSEILEKLKALNGRFKEIKKIEEQTLTKPIIENPKRIQELCADHYEIRKLIYKSNLFWSIYFLILYLTYIPCFFYMCNSLFFSGSFNLILVIYCSIILIHIFIIMSIVFWSAISVDPLANKPIFEIERISRLEMPKYILRDLRILYHHLMKKPIGYSISKFFTMTTSSVLSNVALWVSTFLVVADFSKSVYTTRYFNSHNITIIDKQNLSK